MNGLGTRKLLSGLGAVAALTALSQLTGSAVATTRAHAPTTQRVIVVLKNQEARLPATRSLVAARRSAIRQAQAPVTKLLSSSGARNIHAYTVIDAMSATVPRGDIAQLKSNPNVAAVIPDQVIHLAPASVASTAAATGTGTAPLPGACAPPGQTQLEPQALEAIHADSQTPGAQTARSLGFTGKGVTVAFIADGLDTNNPDFIRPDGSHVFVDYKDFSGEGTGVPTGGAEAFGDASSIAAQGHQVYDVSHYSALPLDRPCNIRVEGVAPGAYLVGLTIFGREDAGFNSSFLQAIDYAVSVDHVNVLNESLGNNYYPDDSASLDVIKQANDLAVAAGTTVTVSSGDAGVTSTIGTPSTDPNVISAAASTTYRQTAQIHYGGFMFPGITGWLDNNISSFSSGGFEQDGRTVDVTAPGEDNWALCTPDPSKYSECVNYAGNPTPVESFGGTSESAPLTAGVAALVIEAYRNTHGGASPTPAVIKQIITSTADDLRAPAEQQGAGIIDAYKAVLAAESYKAPSPAGDTLLTSPSQLNAVANPRSAQTLTDTVTNNGSDTQTVSLSSRTLGAYQTVKTASVNLSDTNSPNITDWQGISDNYQTVTFNVPAGEDRLNAAIAFKNADPFNLAARVRMTLVDPNGKFAEYSRPQGDGNYGDIQITDPAAGHWTAYIYSRNSGSGGTTGPVVFGAAVAKYVPFGQVSPSTLTLAPGQSSTVTLRVSTRSTPGDQAGSIVLSSNQGPSFGQVGTIPVTLRSLIPQGRESFTGTLTGGNGRAFFIGQTFYYQLDLPFGKPELNAVVKLAHNPNNPFQAWLVSPSGEALAFSTNDLPTSSAPGYIPELGAQLHVLSPAQGSWTLIVTFAPAVSGTAISEPFTVSTDEAAVPSARNGLPDSSKVVLTNGQPSTFYVQIRNSGPEPEAYFLDARQPTTTQLGLAAQNSPNTTEPLTVNANIPTYLVPTHTTSWFALARTPGTQQIQFDALGPTGDPDVISNRGTTVHAPFADNPIEQGPWGLAPTEVGPFGTTGGPSENVITAMSVTTNRFDSAVSSPTGDLWFASADPSTLGSFNPDFVNPGSWATIPVTITPNAPSGTTVHGTLYIDDGFFLIYQYFTTLNGNEVAAIPYQYKVK
jgi:Subtilase family